MKEKTIAILHALFPEIDANVIDRLFGLAELKQYGEKVTLCRNGEIEDTLYVLIEGQVDIYRYPEAEPILVDYLTPGACFGEIALILDAPRSGDVITSEASIVLEINRSRFAEISEQHPEIMRAVTRLILERMLRQEERRLLQLVKQQKKRLSSTPIFVSYSHKDEQFAKKLTTHLKAHHFNIWLDVFEIRAGSSWARQIGQALDDCNLMLLILSPESLVSENVEDEWNYYLDKKKPIIPIMYRACDIPYRLFKLQYIDFVNLPYGSALTQLIANLNLFYMDL